MMNLKIAAVSLASLAGIAIGMVGVASAATPTSGATIGTSGIPRSIFKNDRLDAEASVLNVPTTTIQADHKNKTFKTLLTAANLTPKTFRSDVTTKLTSELASQGYTQDQITIALQQHEIHRLHHSQKK